MRKLIQMNQARTLGDLAVPPGNRLEALRGNLSGLHSIRINEIVHARRSITPAMSIRFGAFFGQSDEFWHGIQVECDFRKLTGERKKLTESIRPASTLSQAV